MLTGKQKQFADEYLIDLNATQAATRAGYSAKTAGAQGFELLKKPEIQEYIVERQQKRSERTGITQDYVLNTIVETIERCKQGEPVRDRDGKETGEWKFEPNAVLKGAELLGRHLKLFTDKTELTGKNGAPLQVLMTSDDAAL